MNTATLHPPLTDARASSSRPLWLAVGLVLCGGVLAVLGLGVGSTGLESVWNMLADPVAAQIVREIRAPRTAGAFAAGALLGLAGAVAQGLFRNPLADPFLPGSASGASLGVALAPLRAAVVGVLALATGTAVAQTGLIAFVGLAAPHLVRAVVKTTHGWLVLLASLMGGVLLMLADTLARGLLAPQELPVGVLTAVLGGGYLLWLMRKRVG